MKKLLWASVHQPTEAQLAELQALGQIVLLEGLLLDKLSNTPQNKVEIHHLAGQLLRTAVMYGCTHIVQPSGSLAFQFTLGYLMACSHIEQDLEEFGINHIVAHEGQFYDLKVLYAHSERVSEDIPQPDGSIKKVNVFKHICFV